MRKDRVAAATELSEAFMPAEKAQHEATLRGAESLLVALRAPAAARLPAKTGAKAIAALARGVAIQAEARQAFLEAHTEFSAVAMELKLHELGWGCTGDSPRLSGAEVHQLQPKTAVA